jgi:hypothetical protein
MTKVIPSELVRVGSHTVTLDRSGKVEREEMFPVFNTEWRGQPATLQMEANRYRHSQGMSDWRIFPRDAREGHYDVRTYGNELTDTARQRLGEQNTETVSAWLASDEYAASRRLAFVYALRRIAGELRTYGDVPSRDLRTAVERCSDELTSDDVGRFISVAQAFDTFARLLKETDPS